MKKTARKLVLRKETVRELSEQALSRVIGGEAVPQTRDKQCLPPDLIVAQDGVARNND